MITIFSPLRVFAPISVASLLLGVIYGFTNFAIYGRIPNGAVILILFAVMVFLVGLISEQILARLTARRGRNRPCRCGLSS